jgi:large subunit ribosomal protein L25
MKAISLSGSLRENVGKKDAKAIRNAGKVPCVLYGSGKQTHFSVDALAIGKVVYSPDVYQGELDIDGKKTKAIIQELQQNPVSDRITHVDFLELTADKMVKVSLPVRTIGVAPGVIRGGKLQQVYRRLQMLGFPQDLPADVTLDISKLKIGSAIRVKHIEIPNVQILDPANSVVVSVKMARGASKNQDDDVEEEEATEE